MPFAALQHLVQPSLAGLAALAHPQRKALATAVGLRRGAPADLPDRARGARPALGGLCEPPDAPRPRRRPLADARAPRCSASWGAASTSSRAALSPRRAAWSVRIDAARLPELERAVDLHESAGRFINVPRRGWQRAPSRRCSTSRPESLLPLLEQRHSASTSPGSTSLTERLERAVPTRRSPRVLMPPRLRADACDDVGLMLKARRVRRDARFG